MEMIFNNGFVELKQDEMMEVEGGGPYEWLDEFVKGLTGHTIDENCNSIGQQIRNFIDNSINLSAGAPMQDKATPIYRNR